MRSSRSISAIKRAGKRWIEAPYAIAGPRHRVVVLCYHSVHPSGRAASVTPERFDEQLDWIESICDVVSLGDILFRAQSRSSTRPVVAITFDDGYSDNFEYALPRLLARGMTATFFVTVGLIEQRPSVVHRIGQLWGLPAADISPLSWHQLREMQSQGMTIGSHTYSHPNLARLDRSELMDEIGLSKKVLEDRLDVEVDSLAYPFGKPRLHLTRPTVECAAALGYKLGVQVLPRGVRRHDDPLRIPRFGISEDALSRVQDKIQGRMDGHGLIHERSPAWLIRLLFPHYDTAS
jgi:peptidoglycan/xylan/chitin deacetylase (PgdA/CDA1 family)